MLISFGQAGVVWRLVPLLFRYDSTLEQTAADAKHENNEQKVTHPVHSLQGTICVDILLLSL